MRAFSFWGGGRYVILNQKLYEEDGKTVLENRIDCQAAIDMAREVTASGGRGKNIVPLGFIPPEMWLFNPWLVEARKAQKGGDMGEFTRLVKKFFELHPAFAVGKEHQKRYWQGGVSGA